jgi:pantoate--beta-alanine ligase
MQHLTSFSEPSTGLAFVPTMGALHDGHLALIRQARNVGKKVLVSVYVNPTQFESTDDLAKYPEKLEQDVKLAESAGADFLWTPSVTEIYPEGLAKVKLIPAGSLGDMYEGASRPHHFSGVLTVINRLFAIVQPEFAIFGEKDFQQLFLIRRFAREFFPNIQILAGATVRDKNGIALSSRNARLSPAELAMAQVLPRAQENARGSATVIALKASLEQTLHFEPGFTLDYAQVVDPKSLLPAADDLRGVVQVLLAGWIGSVRLIDNFPLEVKGQP